MKKKLLSGVNHETAIIWSYDPKTSWEYGERQ